MCAAAAAGLRSCCMCVCVDAINRYPGGRSSPAGLIIHGAPGVIQIFNRITVLSLSAGTGNKPKMRRRFSCDKYWWRRAFWYQTHTHTHKSSRSDWLLEGEREMLVTQGSSFFAQRRRRHAKPEKLIEKFQWLAPMFIRSWVSTVWLWTERVTPLVRNREFCLASERVWEITALLAEDTYFMKVAIYILFIHIFWWKIICFDAEYFP